MEYVLAKDLFRFIDRSYPDLTNVRLAEIVGRDDKRVWNIRHQERVSFEIADHFLTRLDLNYLLATGDIPVYISETKKEKAKKATAAKTKTKAAPKPKLSVVRGDHEENLRKARERYQAKKAAAN